MSIGTSSTRARIRRIAAAMSACSGAAVLVATLMVGAPSAGAAAIGDADAAGAARVADQLIAADTTIRVNSYLLPGAESQVTSTAAAVIAAVAEEDRVQSVGPAAPGVGATDVVSAATSAILDDLAPEGASASRLAAESAAAEAIAARDALRAGFDAAVQQKAALIASLEQSGQRRTYWCVLLLEQLGAPITLENLHGLFSWIGAESNAASLLNPLATTEGAPGARNANSVGVKGYPSLQVGLDATIRTLHNGHYPAILAALAQGDSALRITEAVAASPWGTGKNATLRLLADYGG